MSTIKETCYAVRLGDPRRHTTYLMIDQEKSKRHQRMVPELFSSRDDAEKACPKQPNTRVVRVRITCG